MGTMPNWRGARWTLALLLAASAGARAQGPDASAANTKLSDTEPPPLPPEEDPGAPPPAEALPPAQPLTMEQVDTVLTLYGRWYELDDYGRVWVPAAASNSEWQPYIDGSWVYTDAGWAFSSNVVWGAIVFHYGRWGWRDGLGWFWVPGSVWAPAWVSWRCSDDYVAWAPFAPRGFSFGPGWHGWVLIAKDHFTHPIAREMIPRAHGGPIVRQSRPAPSIERAPEAGRFYGPPQAIVPRPARRK